MSTDRDDGGQAFPQPLSVGPSGDLYPAFAGMTLRDYFAAQALAPIFTDAENETAWKHGDGPNEAYSTRCARLAYQMADAMLAERSK